MVKGYSTVAFLKTEEEEPVTVVHSHPYSFQYQGGEKEG